MSRDALVDAIVVASLFNMIVRLADSFDWRVQTDEELSARAEVRLGESYALMTAADLP